MKRNKPLKRALAAVLSLAMLPTAELPLIWQTVTPAITAAAAETGEDGSQTPGQLLGINTDAAPDDFDENDEFTNPYGKRDVVLGNAQEVYVQHMGGDATGYIVGDGVSSVGGKYTDQDGKKVFSYYDGMQVSQDNYLAGKFGVKNIGLFVADNENDQKNMMNSVYTDSFGNSGLQQLNTGTGGKKIAVVTYNSYYSNTSENDIIRDVRVFEFPNSNSIPPETIAAEDRLWLRVPVYTPDGMTEVQAEYGELNAGAARTPESGQLKRYFLYYTKDPDRNDLNKEISKIEAVSSPSGCKPSMVQGTNGWYSYNAAANVNNYTSGSPVYLKLNEFTDSYIPAEGSRVHGTAPIQKNPYVNKTAAGNFDGNSDLKKYQFAMVAFDGNDLLLGVVDSRHPGTSSEPMRLGSVNKSAIPDNLTGAELTYANQIAGINDLEIVTGDFDANGIDDIAVYNPGPTGGKRVQIYSKTLSGDPEDIDNWELKRSISTDGYVTLTAGDFNGDGIDDLLIGDKYAAVYHGARQNMLGKRVALTAPLLDADEQKGCYAVTSFTENGTLYLAVANCAQIERGNWISADQASNYYAYASLYVFKSDGKNGYVKVDAIRSTFLGNGCSFKGIPNKMTLYYANGMFATASSSFDAMGGFEDAYYRYRFDAQTEKLSRYAIDMKYRATLGFNPGFIQSATNGSATYQNYLNSKKYKQFAHTIITDQPYDVYAEKITAGTYFYLPYDFQVAYLNGDTEKATVFYKVMELHDNSVAYYQYASTPYFDGSGKLQYDFGISYASNRDSTAAYNGYSSTKKANTPTCFAVVDTDDDAFFLHYTGKHWFEYTDPQVLAVLSAPPAFKDLLEQDGLSGSYDGSSTSFGKSHGSSDSSSYSNTISAGAYVSYEQDITLFGVKIGSFETELSTKYSHTWQNTHSDSIDYSVEFSTSAGADAVVFYSIPYEYYEYEVVGNDMQNGERTRIKRTMCFPKQPCTTTMELEKYQKLADSYSGLPQLPADTLKHTLGEPASYPKNTNGYRNVRVYDGPFMAVDFTSASGGMSQSQTIEMSSEDESAYSNSVEVEAKVGGGLGSVKVGITAGYEYESSFAHTNTSGHSFTASVQNMPKEAERYGYGMSWKLFSHENSYVDNNGNNVNFFVVDYLVTDVMQPPMLPTNFRQDYEKTTTNQVALKWDYDVSPANVSKNMYFNVYRITNIGGRKVQTLIGKVNYNRSLTTYSFIDKGTALNGAAITMQPDTQYSYCVEAARSLDEPPSFSMPSETISAYTRADGDYPDLKLTGAYSGKLTVYPDRVYTIKALVSNADAFRQLSYQWQKKDSRNNWVDIPNENSYIFRVMKATHETSGDYRCRIDALAKTSILSSGVTVYTDVFSLTHKMRTVQESAFTTSCRSAKPDATFTIRPSMQTCFVAPTGTVTFTLSSSEKEQKFTVPLKASDKTATAKLSDSKELQELPDLADGIYYISAHYDGDSVFSSYTAASKKPVLVGDNQIVPVLFNSKGERTDSFLNGDTMTVKFFKYNKGNDGATIETPCTVEGYPNGITEAIAETDNFPQGRDYSSSDPNKFIYFPKTVSREIMATIKPQNGSSETKKYTYSFSVSKRPLEVGVISGELYSESVEGNLPQLQILSGTLADGDQLSDLVTLTFMNAAKTMEMPIDNYTEPGTYYASVDLTDSDRIKLYDIRLYPAEFNVNAKRYSVKLTAEQCDGADAGTIKMSLPESRSGLLRQTYQFESGTLLKLTAVANTGYHFDHWLVNGKEYNTETISVSMPRKDSEIQLFFRSYLGNLSLNKTYAEGASITEPSGFTSGKNYPVGTKFTFTANDSTNYQFDHWIEVIGNTSCEYDSRTLEVTVTNENTRLYPIYTGKPCTVTLGSRFAAEYTYVNGQEETVTEKLTSGKKVPYGATLKLTALDTASMAHYEWYVNGVKKVANQQTLTVKVEGATDVKLVPLIETQPTDFTGSLGTNAVFSVKANGSGLTYQWQFLSSTGWQNSGAAGAQTATLTIPVTAERDGQQYRCMVRRADGISGTTKAVSIKLKPAITKQPVSFGGQVGDVAHFSVEATGKNLTYQWQFMMTSGIWKDSGMTGAKTKELAVEVTDARDGQQYRCIVKNSNGLTETSEVCHIYISPIITSQPKSFEGSVNDTAKFTVAASGKSLTYQWQFLDNGIWKNSGMSGAKTATLNVTATEARNGQQYRCVITSSSGAEVISQAVSINLRAKITAHPKNYSGKIGSTAKFTVTASGKNLTYQWQFNTGSGWQNSGLTGATTNTLNVEVTEARDKQQYRCLVKAGNTAAVASAAASIQAAAAVTEDAQDYSGAIGDNAAFTVKASGIGLTYQWQFLSSTGWQNSGMTGAHTASLNVEVTAARDGQKYRCVVKSSNGTTATSKEVTIHAVAGVTGQPKNYAGKIGDIATFSVTAIGENLTYQWQFLSSTGWQDSGMAGADTASLKVEVTAARNGQQYRCVVTSPDGTVVTSDSAKITVK